MFEMCTWEPSNFGNYKAKVWTCRCLNRQLLSNIGSWYLNGQFLRICTIIRSQKSGPIFFDFELYLSIAQPILLLVFTLIFCCATLLIKVCKHEMKLTTQYCLPQKHCFFTIDFIYCWLYFLVWWFYVQLLDFLFNYFCQTVRLFNLIKSQTLIIDSFENSLIFIWWIRDIYINDVTSRYFSLHLTLC